jgi:hypothetical protein
MVTALSKMGIPKPPKMSGINFGDAIGEKREKLDEKGRPFQTPPLMRGCAEARMTARNRDSSGLISAPCVLTPEG